MRFAAFAIGHGVNRRVRVNSVLSTASASDCSGRHVQRGVPIVGIGGNLLPLFE